MKAERRETEREGRGKQEEHMDSCVERRTVAKIFGIAPISRIT